MSERFDVEEFIRCRGESFRLFAAEGEPQTVELVEVRDLGHRATSGGELSNYVLTFRTPPGVRASQGIYHLEHARLGVLEMFLVPVGNDAGRTDLEAVFY